MSREKSLESHLINLIPLLKEEPFSMKISAKEEDYISIVSELIPLNGGKGISYISAYNQIQLRKFWPSHDEILEKLLFPKVESRLPKLHLSVAIMKYLLKEIRETPTEGAYTKFDPVYIQMIEIAGSESPGTTEDYAEKYNKLQRQIRKEYNLGVRKEIVQEEIQRGQFSWILDVKLP